MSGAHSVLAPSSAARYVQCPASVPFEQSYPETEQAPEAAEGEASHWAAAELLAGRLPDIGDRAANGILLSKEMVEGADLYHDDVVAALRPYGLTPADGAIEASITIPEVHSECWGTPDYRIWIPASRRPSNRPLLMLWDYKFGHRYVEVVENLQLVFYVSGCLSATNLLDLDVDVEVRIVQPRSYSRAGPVRRWAFAGPEIRPLINIAASQAAIALRPDPPAKTGPECRDCRARHACPALQRAAYNAIDESLRAQPVGLGPDALGLELRLLAAAEERINARRSGLEQQALVVAKAGAHVPGWRVEHGVGRKRWAKPVEEVLALGRVFGLDLAKPVEPVTPVQAVAKGIPETLLPHYVETPRGSATLVPDDGREARAIFGKGAA